MSKGETGLETESPLLTQTHKLFRGCDGTSISEMMPSERSHLWVDAKPRGLEWTWQEFSFFNPRERLTDVCRKVHGGCTLMDKGSAETRTERQKRSDAVNCIKKGQKVNQQIESRKRFKTLQEIIFQEDFRDISDTTSLKWLIKDIIQNCLHN